MSVSTAMREVWIEFAATKSPELRDELIEAYAPFVRYIVGRMGIPPTSMLEPDDLIHYGMIGLMKAMDRFEPARGVHFEAFATARIRGEVIDQLRSLNWQPRSVMTRIRQIESTMAELEQQLGRSAGEEEAALALGVSIEHYRHMLTEVGLTVLSLDAPLNAVGRDDEAASLGDLLEDQTLPGTSEQVEHQEMLGLLSEAIDLLPARERLLLALYYQEELTMKEISKVMEVSESRICQLHMQAVLRLRGKLEIDEPVAQAAKGTQPPTHTRGSRQKVHTVS
ncbi:MAG: FliA/WhiG family RNA polymerase sigma factor [Chloroflexota bacterium]|nr:FliA/WhiG family RNA polymerase sigma factor [Chloroflexota bacterium]